MKTLEALIAISALMLGCTNTPGAAEDGAGGESGAEDVDLAQSCFQMCAALDCGGDLARLCEASCFGVELFAAYDDGCGTTAWAQSQCQFMGTCKELEANLEMQATDPDATWCSEEARAFAEVCLAELPSIYSDACSHEGQCRGEAFESICSVQCAIGLGQAAFSDDPVCADAVEAEFECRANARCEELDSACDDAQALVRSICPVEPG